MKRQTLRTLVCAALLGTAAIAAEWSIAAMDDGHVLLFDTTSPMIAVCPPHSNGQSADPILIERPSLRLVPVALENNVILLQEQNDGALLTIQFDETGAITEHTTIWSNSMGWVACGMDANRILLKHSETGNVVIWTINPQSPLFRPYPAFILPDGWDIRNFQGDWILIQHGASGPMQEIELGEGYKPRAVNDVKSDHNGWNVLAHRTGEPR